MRYVPSVRCGCYAHPCCSPPLCLPGNGSEIAPLSHFLRQRLQALGRWLSLPCGQGCTVIAEATPTDNTLAYNAGTHVRSSCAWASDCYNSTITHERSAQPIHSACIYATVTAVCMRNLCMRIVCMHAHHMHAHRMLQVARRRWRRRHRRTRRRARTVSSHSAVERCVRCVVGEYAVEVESFLVASTACEVPRLHK